MHVEQRMTPAEIAARYGCSRRLVAKRMAELGIEKLPNYKRLEGQRFGRLVAVRMVRMDPTAGATWECRCDCGGSHEALAAVLLRGQIRSCGCLIGESNITHGLSDSRPYHIWQGMKTRCTNPRAVKYHLYGGRGIGYPPEWETFEGFWADMAEGYEDGLTLERIDNDAGYCKDNCAWVDYRAQNRHRSFCAMLDHGGRRMTITEWAEEYGIDRKRIYEWRREGLSGDELFARMENLRRKKGGT